VIVHEVANAAAAASILIEHLRMEVPERPEIEPLTQQQLDDFEAALLVELQGTFAQAPVEVSAWTDTRLLRAAHAAGISLDYRWPDNVRVSLL